MQNLLRHRFLRKHNIIDSQHNVALNDVTYLVTKLFDCDFATISIVDTQRIWFKSICGLDVKEIPLEEGLCGTAFNQDEPTIINDTLLNDLARKNSLVSNPPNVRSYMAAPISLYGVPFGTLTALSTQTRSYSSSDASKLEALAKVVMGILEQEVKYHESTNAQKDQIELFRQFLDSSGDVITFIDSDYRFRYTNQAGKDMCREAFGRSPEKGDYFFDYITEKSHEVYKLMLKQVFTGQQIDVERPILGVHHRVYISPVNNLSGEIIGAMFLLHNMHDKYLANKALKENVDFLHKLAWSQSHEIRKPLANILGLIEVIGRLPEKSEKLIKVSTNLGLAGKELDAFLRKNVKNLEDLLPE